VNRFDENGREFGSVGPFIEGVEVKIAEDGEILCKGPNIMMGYYKRPDLTADVMQGDWFMTGDIGTFSSRGYLKITDRKKELFKTSGGKYVAPLPIESRLKESIFIEQTMVIGADRKFVSALIVPSFPNLLDWCRQQGISETNPVVLCKHPRVIEHYQELVESFNKFFNPVEQVKKFALLPNDWGVDSGELTPKLSLKRKVILEKFKESIEQIYA
jgi:long-chain acyl-CoA synthetase